MSESLPSCMLDLVDDHFTIEDYQSSVPRWCVGCGDHAVLTAVQRLCRDERLPPEKTVFVSGIGCSSRFPHYLKTYGFHGLHGRALPVAQGIKIKRPDLHVFVIMGDGDCCSIGTAHWIHALRYNMNMTAIVLDNGIYGLTKKQVSPTSPRGQVSNTTPSGSHIDPLNPIDVTLGVGNASFVAQAVDWIPDLVHDIIQAGFRHRGFSFIRVLQRCPEYMAHRYDDWVQHPEKMLLLKHENGLEINADIGRIYRNQQDHDPADRNRAREIAAINDPLPVGILYRNESVPCYEDEQVPDVLNTAERVKVSLEAEFDKFTIEPSGESR
jgi:2-oxoglutarate ferredoxin oxidoreductase subunit beta